MKMTNLLIFAVVGSVCLANSAPIVTNVTATQRADGSGYVDISFKLTDSDNDHCIISILVSNDGGSTWTITPLLSSFSSTRFYPGSRTIAWNSKIDLPGAFGSSYRIKVTADDNYSPPGPNITWVQINDPGVFGHEAFNGQMSKYETTNAQYCVYLNAAKTSNMLTVSDNYVVGISGPYSGQNYYYLAGIGNSYIDSGATNGGAARINWTGSTFTVDAGFESHPVTYVSWYGATAFASYYGWRLPTEWEWQAVADYNGGYTYGCGTTINNSMANYYGSTHPNGTTAVCQYGPYGYGMCDMAGNVCEWTSSLWDPAYSARVYRGGSWLNSGSVCTVSTRFNPNPSRVYYDLGFRVCR